jgi:hypothetical protein
MDKMSFTDGIIEVIVQLSPTFVFIGQLDRYTPINKPAAALINWLLLLDAQRFVSPAASVVRPVSTPLPDLLSAHSLSTTLSKYFSALSCRATSSCT